MIYITEKSRPKARIPVVPDGVLKSAIEAQGPARDALLKSPKAVAEIIDVRLSELKEASPGIYNFLVAGFAEYEDYFGTHVALSFLAAQLGLIDAIETGMELAAAGVATRVQ